MRKPNKKYSEMTPAELAEATKEFNENFAFTKGRPLTPAEKKQHATARRRGRPRIGQGAEKIRVSVERGLLNQTNAFAKRHGLSRSEMIARGLRAVLAGAA